MMSSRNIRYRAQVGRWLLLGSVHLLLASCEPANDIGVGIQSPDSSGSFYVDTFTVRTSTVLIDSVASSSSSYLMLGRYVDAQLGTVTARSFMQLGLEASFTPASTVSYDSLVLELAADTLRYGDTTQVQHVQVHRLRENFSASNTYYTSSTLAYDAQPLATRAFRARPRLTSLRIRLPDALGQELMALGRNGQLTTTDELRYYLPGLVLAPAATDNAALLRLSANATTQVLHLYYHEAATPNEVAGYSFSFSGRHFYQMQSDRKGTQLASLSTTGQTLASGSTAEETFIQNGVGLYTRVEMPHLLALQNLGGTPAVVSASLEVLPVNGTATRYLPPPSALAVYQSDRANRRLAVLTTAPYYFNRQAANGLEQGQYTADLTTYVRAVLARSTTNEGLLLGATTTDTPQRVVLGSQRNTSNPLKLKIYYTRVE